MGLHNAQRCADSGKIINLWQPRLKWAYRLARQSVCWPTWCFVAATYRNIREVADHVCDGLHDTLPWPGYIVCVTLQLHYEDFFYRLVVRHDIFDVLQVPCNIRSQPRLIPDRVSCGTDGWTGCPRQPRILTTWGNRDAKVSRPGLETETSWLSRPIFTRMWLRNVRVFGIAILSVVVICLSLCHVRQYVYTIL